MNPEFSIRSTILEQITESKYYKYHFISKNPKHQGTKVWSNTSMIQSNCPVVVVVVVKSCSPEQVQGSSDEEAWISLPYIGWLWYVKNFVGV